MRAEDLFEAMEGIDEDLIARSEIRMRRTPNKQSGKEAAPKEAVPKEAAPKERNAETFTATR